MDSAAAHSVEVAACADGELCRSGRAGHRLLPIQERVIAASPSGWRDAIVTASTADGWIEIVFLAGERRARLWHHSHLAALGEPVAFHPAAGALAAASTVVNVLAR